MSNDTDKETSDGSTASYYELPEGATEIQHLISHKDMNAQMGEIFRATYRYGQVAHSDMIRDIKKILFYGEAELERLLACERGEPAVWGAKYCMGVDKKYEESISEETEFEETTKEAIEAYKKCQGADWKLADLAEYVKENMVTTEHFINTLELLYKIGIMKSPLDRANWGILKEEKGKEPRYWTLEDIYTPAFMKLTKKQKVDVLIHCSHLEDLAQAVPEPLQGEEFKKKHSIRAENWGMDALKSYVDDNPGEVERILSTLSAIKESKDQEPDSDSEEEHY